MSSSQDKPGVSDWIKGVGLGAVLGAAVLGIVGRIAMRLLALMQEWTLSFTLSGSTTIVMIGAAAGAGFAVVLLLIQSVPRLPRLAMALLYWAVLAGMTLRVLQPVDRDRLTVFPPVAVIFGLAQYLLCRRVQQPRN
jgi:hypothetical protein